MKETKIKSTTRNPPVHTFPDVTETYETSGFFRASRPKYNMLMVAPPPMKMKRGMS